MHCPYCGAELVPGQKFCKTTGKELPAIEPTLQLEEISETRVPSPIPPETKPNKVPLRDRSKKAKFSNKSKMIKRGLIASGVILVILLVFLAVDPFNLHVVGRINGNYDAAAEVMPEDVDLYIGGNILNFRPLRTKKLIQPFENALDEVPFEEQEASLGILYMFIYLSNIDPNGFSFEEIKNSIYPPESLDIDFYDDLLPWIGQYAGLGISGLDIEESLWWESAEYTLAVEARNKKKADEFLEKLSQTLSNLHHTPLQELESGNIRVYEMNYSSTSKKISFFRKENMVIFLWSDEDIDTFINNSDNKTLAKQDDFQEMIRQLPARRLLTAYISKRDPLNQSLDLIEEFYPNNNSGYSYYYGNMLKSGIQHTAIAFSLLKSDLRMDFLTSYDLEKLSKLQKEYLKNIGGDKKTVLNLPKDTLFYVSGKNLNLSWMLYKNEIIDLNTSELLEDDLIEFADKSNMDFDQEIMQNLDDAWTVGIFPDYDEEKTFLIDNIGFNAVFLSSNPTTLANAIQTLAISEGNEISTYTTSDQHFYEISLKEDSPYFSYNINKDHLNLGSDLQRIINSENGENTLAESQIHDHFLKILPVNYSPTYFFNLKEFYNLLLLEYSESEQIELRKELSLIAPISALAIAQRPIKDNMVNNLLILSFDLEKEPVLELTRLEKGLLFMGIGLLLSSIGFINSGILSKKQFNLLITRY